MVILKPCPFCGGEADFLSYYPGEWMVRCKKCLCKMEKWKETKQEAADQWNRRYKEDETND